MKLIRNIADYKDPGIPLALSIGNFDGVHLGHRAVLRRLTDLAAHLCGKTAVISFENHPTEVLKPGAHSLLLCTTEHKIKLLQAFGIDTLILLSFDRSFAEQQPEEFLAQLKKHVPFTHLVLGYDARIGKNRSGTPEQIKRIADILFYEVEYADPLIIDGSTVSSSLIRQHIKNGQLRAAEKYLGRPYSIFAKISYGATLGRKIGYPTANIDVGKLCLPPFGVYTVVAECEGIRYNGIANLGVAPTLKDESPPLLEIHLFDCSSNLYEKDVEVFFGDYLRPEMQFSGPLELKEQIAKDIAEAKKRQPAL